MIQGAKYLGMDADIGSLEAGKLADVLVLDANPLDNIRDTEKIHLVVANGRVYNGTTLDEEGNHPRKRLPFFWELPKPAFSALGPKP